MMNKMTNEKALKLGLLMLALLAGITFAANCGQGIKACECGDTMMASYTMASDLICDGNTNGIAIGANGVTLDCANHKIQTRWKYDVLIGDGRSNIIVKNCVLVGTCGYDGGGSFSSGANILIVDGDAAYNANQPLTGASNIQVLNSRTESFTVGPQGGGWTQECAGRSMESFFSSGITVTNFSMGGGEQAGIFLFTCHDNIMTNISGGGMDGIYLQGSWNNQIKNSNVNAQMQGIAIYNYQSQCSNNTVVNSRVWGGGSNGIRTGGSCDNNKIINSTGDSGGGSGIYIGSNNNQITNCNASSYWEAGLQFGSAANNIVTGGVIRGTIGYSPQYIQCGNYDPYGIAFYSSSSNTITNSTISTGSANTPLDCGIAVRVYDAGSSGNMIYNNIISSPALLSLGDGAGTQTWDNGITGNYYMNPSNTGYSQTCAATANVCNIPLTLSGSNIDNKPLKNLPSWYRKATPEPEVCDNSIDDDQDSFTDCADTEDCASDPACQPPPEPSCTDVIQNQDETDVDCGGTHCSKCIVGKICNTNTDCQTDKCQSGICTEPELILDSTGGTVAEQGITVTVPAGALPTTELLVTIVPSTHSFAAVAGTVVLGQPLDIGPQCIEIASQATCESTNGCQWTGSCTFIPFESPVTISMPGDCSGTKKIYQQKIAKYIGTSWVPVVTCTPISRGGGFYSCTATDGRLATWNQTSCMMSVQTWTFSSYAVTEYSVQYCSTHILQQGVWAVDYDVTDTYGNRITGTSDPIKVDPYPPSTLPQLTGVVGNNGWFKSDVVVDFITSDSMSGVYATYYSLDNETWNTWAGADTLAITSTTDIYYYSEDVAGNLGEIQAIHIAIDKVAPEITASDEGTAGAGEWWTSIVSSTITAIDPDSGVQQVCRDLGLGEECVQAPQGE